MLHAHEIDDIADRFRHWLRETDEELNDPQVVALAEQLTGPSDDRIHAAAPVGLLQLVESLTAMRHDYKLQTKGLRQLHEDVQGTLTGMNNAAEELRTAYSTVNKEVEQASTDAAEPLLHALLDIDEALGQAIVTAEMPTDLAIEDADRGELLKEVQNLFDELPRWKRFLIQRSFHRLRARLSAGDRPDAVVGDAGTLEGLRLLRIRVRRALNDSGVTPLASVGRRVDPRTMRVVDVVSDSNQPPETVVEEVRAGYIWGDKTIRVAEVRATQSRLEKPVQS